MKKSLLTLSVAAAAVMAAGTVSAADFPARPIQVIVPYSAGGSTDLSLRVFADIFEKNFEGKQMVIPQPARWWRCYRYIGCCSWASGWIHPRRSRSGPDRHQAAYRWYGLSSRRFQFRWSVCALPAGHGCL